VSDPTIEPWGGNPDTDSDILGSSTGMCGMASRVGQKRCMHIDLGYGSVAAEECKD